MDPGPPVPVPTGSTCGIAASIFQSNPVLSATRASGVPYFLWPMVRPNGVSVPAAPRREILVPQMAAAHSLVLSAAQCQGPNGMAQRDDAVSQQANARPGSATNTGDNIMNRNSAHIAFRTLATLTLFGLAAVAQARECTLEGVAGRYGYTSSGSIINPAIGAFLAVGQATFTKAGTFSGTQTTSFGGTLVEETTDATYTVNPDCTGTAVVHIYHGSTLARTTNLIIVWDSHQQEARGLFLSPGTAVSILARKMFGEF